MILNYSTFLERIIHSKYETRVSPKITDIQQSEISGMAGTYDKNNEYIPPEDIKKVIVPRVLNDLKKDSEKGSIISIDKKRKRTKKQKRNY